MYTENKPQLEMHVKEWKTSSFIQINDDWYDLPQASKLPITFSYWQQEKTVIFFSLDGFFFPLSGMKWTRFDSYLHKLFCYLSHDLVNIGTA